MPAHVKAVTLALLSCVGTASSPVARGRCNSNTCIAEPQKLPAHSPHYALLQVRGRLSVSAIKHEEVENGERAHRLLPAESLIELPVFSQSSNLTAFEKDYIEDASNPLDVGEQQAAAHDAAVKASASSASTSGTAAAGPSGTAAPGRCCKARTAQCLACQNKTTVDEYCLSHGTVRGCERVFDCGAGLDNWKRGWSNMKKLWCCTYKKKGCPADSSNSTDASTSGSKPDLSWENDLVTDADAADASGSSMGNSTSKKNETTENKCVTKQDPRATSFGYTTSLPGTPCVFGIDDRDEGYHCIMEDGKFGSFGWCWTSMAMSSWGSCSESCPLFGPSKVIHQEVEALSKKLQEAMAMAMATTTTATTTNAADVEKQQRDDAANTTSPAPSSSKSWHTWKTTRAPSATTRAPKTTRTTNASSKNTTAPSSGDNTTSGVGPAKSGRITVGPDSKVVNKPQAGPSSKKQRKGSDDSSSSGSQGSKNNTNDTSGSDSKDNSSSSSTIEG